MPLKTSKKPYNSRSYKKHINYYPRHKSFKITEENPPGNGIEDLEVKRFIEFCENKGKAIMYGDEILYGACFKDEIKEFLTEINKLSTSFPQVIHRLK